MYQVFYVYPANLRRLAGVLALAYLALAATAGVAAAQTDDDDVDVVAVFNQAQELHEKGDLAGALKLYEKALKAMPEFPEAEFQRANVFTQLGKPSEAEAAYRRAVTLRPDWSLAMTGLGSMLVNRGQYVEAEPLLRKVLELEPQNPPALAAFAEIRMQAKAPAAELQALLKKLTDLAGKAYPTPFIWVTRAALEVALGRPALAKTSLAKALEIDSKNRNALLQLSDLAIADGDVVLVRDILGRLDTATPPSDDIRLLRANVFVLETKLDEALAELDAIKAPGFPAAELRKRIHAVRTTNPAGLENLLETDRRNVAILARLCSLYRREDPAKSLVYCRQAAEAEPGNVNHAVGFGAALVQAKQFDAAAVLLLKLVNAAPDNATARANLATALFQLKRYGEAIEQFNWLVVSQPRSAGAYLFLGIIHDELTEYMDAAANYQLYVKLADPTANKLDIEKVNLRLPTVQKLIKEGKGKRK